eukprot:3532399-Prymnesium_polylepis.1
MSDPHQKTPVRRQRAPQRPPRPRCRRPSQVDRLQLRSLFSSRRFLASLRTSSDFGETTMMAYFGLRCHHGPVPGGRGTEGEEGVRE